jgi:hypothetical protein
VGAGKHVSFESPEATAVRLHQEGLLVQVEAMARRSNEKDAHQKGGIVGALQ